MFCFGSSFYVCSLFNYFVMKQQQDKIHCSRTIPGQTPVVVELGFLASY